MGAGASTEASRSGSAELSGKVYNEAYELSPEQKGELMRQLEVDFSKNSDMEDLELFKTLSETYTTSMSKLVTGTDSTTAITTTEENNNAAVIASVTASVTEQEKDLQTTETKEDRGTAPDPLTCEAEVVGVKESASSEGSVEGNNKAHVLKGTSNHNPDSDDHSSPDSYNYHEHYDTGASLLSAKTSSDLLKDAIDDEERRQEKIESFLSELKEGNITTSKASNFRTRRLTYAQKTNQDPEPPSPEHKLSRKRTTIFKSDEIGKIREGKAPPFPETQMGTDIVNFLFTCYIYVNFAVKTICLL